MTSLRSITLSVSVLAFTLIAPLGCSSDQQSGGSGEKARVDGGEQRTFATPQEAADAVVTAARNEDRADFRSIFGPDLERLESGDREQDGVDLQRFVAAYELNHFLLDNGDDTFTMVIGLQEWEFPAPIVPAGQRWRFDTDAGIDEIITRTIGMNELHVIDATAAFAVAEQEYFDMDPDGDKVPSYAATIRSTPGKRDGLFWPDEPGAPMSPLGPLFAQAVQSGEIKENVQERQPYRGYYYRILTSQGPGAPGGAMSYIDGNGRMTKGYALIAWPASYGETGIMSFIVNNDGIVYQRDLGEYTKADAEKITAYDPTGWTTIND